MEYSKHIGSVIKEKGIPNMSTYSFNRLMNIVYMEGKINGLRLAASKMAKTGEPKKFDLEIFSETMKLTELTGNVAPEDLLHELVNTGDSML